MAKRILTVCLNPTLQRTLLFDSLRKGEVNRARQGRLDASGKGVNVSRVIDQHGDAGISSHHLSHGGGESGELFAALCRKDHLALTLVPGSGVRTCTTCIDGGDGTVTELIEPSDPVDDATVNGVEEAFRTLLPDSSVLVLSGSVAPGYPEDLFARFCEEAGRAGVPVLADFRGAMLLQALPYRPGVVKINLLEFAATFGIARGASLGEQGDDTFLLPAVEGKMRELQEQGIRFVLSRGSRESLSFDQERGALRFWPVEQVQAVNTIGCGDSFSAGLALSMALGQELSEGIALGHHLAARNASLLKPGALRE